MKETVAATTAGPVDGEQGSTASSKPIASEVNGVNGIGVEILNGTNANGINHATDGTNGSVEVNGLNGINGHGTNGANGTHGTNGTRGSEFSNDTVQVIIADVDSPCPSPRLEPQTAVATERSAPVAIPNGNGFGTTENRPVSEEPLPCPVPPQERRRKNSMRPMTSGDMGAMVFGQQPGEQAHSEGNLNAIGEILSHRKASVAQMMSKTVEGLNHAYELRDLSPEDLIFDLFKVPNKEEASITKLIKVLKSFGLRENDPRLRKMMEKMKKLEDDDDDSRNFLLARAKFKETIHPSVQIISQTLRNHLIIPSWGEFCSKIKEMFEACKTVHDGHVATYIPQLARQDPNIWGMSICTIDGQRISFGDSKINFCVQSVSKAFNYAIVSSDLGADFVHSHVGHEPSGRLFNEICLDSVNKPHNPMINAGAIIVTSLIRNKLSMADRFDFVLNEYRKLAGGEPVGFNNATFLSERDTADRNYALSYYMKEYGCFPPEMRELREELDLYFQLCSLETNCDTAAVMAATLANGGVCPLTGELCIQPRPCRDVLSLMYSCGMYDYSGKFAFSVGLPAKSGVSGVMIVVVPNLMGIALFSPRLDKMGNSCKGVAFCQKLIENFNFHNYDSLLHADSKKLDPRRRIGNRDTELVVSLLFAAKNGDFDTIRRMYLQGMNLELADYDGRTALHIAASEGQLHLVKFLIKVAKVNHLPKDRWGHTPLEDARTFHHEECVRLLLKHHAKLAEEAENKLSAVVCMSDDAAKSPESATDRFSFRTNTPQPKKSEEKDSDEEMDKEPLKGLMLQQPPTVKRFPFNAPVLPAIMAAPPPQVPAAAATLPNGHRLSVPSEYDEQGNTDNEE